jgi:hypothetical protein
MKRESSESEIEKMKFLRGWFYIKTTPVVSLGFPFLSLHLWSLGDSWSKLSSAPPSALPALLIVPLLL